MKKILFKAALFPAQLLGAITYSILQFIDASLFEEVMSEWEDIFNNENK